MQKPTLLFAVFMALALSSHAQSAAADPVMENLMDRITRLAHLPNTVPVELQATPVSAAEVQQQTDAPDSRMLSSIS